MLSSALSSYWILICILLGGVYAYLLYAFGAKPWSKNWNIALFALRFIGVTLVAYLFLEPFLSTRTTDSEKQNIVFLWDNSQSISNSLNAEELESVWVSIKTIAEQLEKEKEVNVDIINLDGEIIESSDSAIQEKAISALDPALKEISDSYSNSLIAEVVLFSDGIFNRGISPEYYAYPFQLSTVGIGDTTEKQDIELKSLRYNKVAYQGNKFPIVAEVIQKGWRGENASIALYKNGKLLEKRVLEFDEENSVKEEKFLIEAAEKGFHSYVLEVAPFEDEFNKNNNRKIAYVNVIEGKKKVLILARAPHPDIKALQQSISNNENYDLSVIVNGLNEYKEDNYDLVVLFHLPDDNNSFKNEIKQFADRRTPLWFISGPGTNASQFNNINRAVQIEPWNDTDQASAFVNLNFTPFELTSEQNGNLQNLPPVDVPFSEATASAQAEILLFKQIGRVKTDQPVFAFFADDQVRQAALLMEGFWKWRLVEYLNTESHAFFDEWVMKTIRYLTSQNDRNQFKLYPEKEEFSSAEEIAFQVEVYNQVYDQIYGIPVNLQLRSEEDSIINFNFSPDRVQPNFQIGSLPAGIYEYTGQTEIADKKHTASGQFVVSDFSVELQNLVADFELLKRVAQKNDGRYFESNSIDSIYNHLARNEYPEIVTGELQKKPLTENYWLYIIIFLILFSEWFIRRFFGSY